MLVKIVTNKSFVSLMNLRNRELLTDEAGKVIKWFYPRQAEEYAKDKFLTLCKLKTNYRGLLIHKGDDSQWYVTTGSNELVMTHTEFKKEATAKELIDWHFEAMA